MTSITDSALLKHRRVPSAPRNGGRREPSNRLAHEGVISFLHAFPTATVLLDCSGVVVLWNDRAAALYGRASTNILGKSMAALGIIPAEEFDLVLASVRTFGHWEGDVVASRADGSALPVQLSVDNYDEDGVFSGFIVASSDLNARLELERSLAFQVLHDSRNDLPNRRLFIEELELLLAERTDGNARVAVLTVGLDQFTRVNERVGRDAGDAILRNVAVRLSTALQDGTLVASLGEDVFAFACADVVSPTEVYAAVEQIRQAVAESDADGRFGLTASFGIALSMADVGAERSLRNAESALHAGGGQMGSLTVFDESLESAARQRRVCATELAQALDDGEVCTFFQPQVALGTGAVVGFEALARWSHPQRGTVPPDEFIPAAEASGLIGRLGRQVLNDACRALASWLKETPELDITVAVNVSAGQLADPTFPEAVRAAINEHDVPPGRVCLEITESALIDADVATRVLRHLKAVGVQLAIDDFGTGYSSLSRLRRFPVDALKIDREFVDGMTATSEDAVIVTAVIGLAKTLGLRIIAEGIETQTQLDELAALGCDAGQGYLWSPAVPGDGASRFLVPGASLSLADTAQHPTALPVALSGGADDGDGSTAFAVLAHEVIGALTVLGGYAELLQTSDEPEVRTQAVEAIGRAARRAAASVQMARDVGRFGAGSLTLTKTDVELADVIAEALEVAASSHQLNVNLERVVSPVIVHGDRERLVALVANLVGNAAKHTPSGTTVRVTVESVDATAVVHVIDDGPGIAPSDVGGIFRKFGRAAGNRSGSGLGLYLARGVARAHGGELSYRAAQGGGADFMLELPAADRARDRRAGATTSRHEVQLYEYDAEIVASVTRMFGQAIRGGHPFLLIATPSHRLAIESNLRGRGLRADPILHPVLDAATTVERLLVDGMPDARLFESVVGARVAALVGASAGRLGIYGEMVGLLWNRGDVLAAMRLEERWNDLGTRHEYSLLCGHQVAPGQSDSYADVCRLHTHVSGSRLPCDHPGT